MISKTLFLALIASPASGFVSRSAPSMAFTLGKKGSAIPEQEKPLTDRLGGVGISEPLAEGFDPLGFASRADAAELIKYREAELKHGRVAMLAVPGFLLSEDFHPFFPQLPKWEFGIFALQDTLEQGPYKALLAAAIVTIGAFESYSFKSWEVPEGTLGSEGSTYFKMKTDIVPGAVFERGPWTSDKLSPEEFKLKQTAEINNGRLAMVSILAIVMQEIVSKVPTAEYDAWFFSPAVFFDGVLGL